MTLQHPRGKALQLCQFCPTIQNTERDGLSKNNEKVAYFWKNWENDHKVEKIAKLAINLAILQV